MRILPLALCLLATGCESMKPSIQSLPRNPPSMERCPPLPKLASDSVDEALRNYAATVGLYADCSGLVNGWIEFHLRK